MANNKTNSSSGDSVTFYMNDYGIRVRRCCASCALKVLNLSTGRRVCLEHDVGVRATDVCPEWRMSQRLRYAGQSTGRVRRMHTGTADEEA